MLGNFACFYVICGFFFKSTFSKKSFRKTIRVSNSLDPDHARHSVGPDLGPTVCKGYQQKSKTATCGEIVKSLTYLQFKSSSINLSLSLKHCKEFIVDNTSGSKSSTVGITDVCNKNANSHLNHNILNLPLRNILTLVLLILNMTCLCKQCRSRRSQLIRICPVCH